MKAKEIRRKLYALALVACMVSMTTTPAQAAGKAPATQPQPTRFTAPEVLKDADGHVYDLGGMEIIVRDWWSSDYEDPDYIKSEYELARDEYLDWIQETYNFTIKQVGISEWSNVPQDFVDYASAPADDNNYVFVLRNDQLLTNAMQAGLCVDLSKLSCLDFSRQKFQTNLTHQVYTFGDAVYAMYAGGSEPRGGVYFNKRLLQEAGVDPDSIYDMQLNGTWTWDAFEELCQKVTRDTDNDGVIDVYACNSNTGVMIEQAVYSNGGNFITKDADGKFVNALKEDASIEGLRFAQHLLDEHWQQEPDGAAWDYYKEAYLNGEYVFLIDEAYVMSANLMTWYDENDHVDPEHPGMNDPVGFVMFPKGPQATDYVNCWSNNFMCIPSNYDAQRAWNIAFAWNLYTDEVPGYENNDEWKKGYEGFDDRALNETLAMMRAKGTVNSNSLVSGIRLYDDFIWQIFPHGNNLDALLKAEVRDLDYLVKKENGEQFPEVLKDAEGRPYDLGGMEIIVADWFSSPELPDDTIQQKARKEYIEWIQETYNFKIVKQAEYQWSDVGEKVLEYVNNGGDDKNYVFTLRPGVDVLDAMRDGKFYDLSTLDCLDFSEEKYQSNLAHEKYSLGNAVYGMSADDGVTGAGLYFNKQVLRQAGIDPDSIYDMQANGTWTWDKFEELCQRLTRDLDNDGTIDVYGCEGHYGELLKSAVYSNGGSFIGKDADGIFTYDIENAATVEGLEFAKKIMDNYWGQDPEGAAGDYYLTAFSDGRVAFCPESVVYSTGINPYFEWYNRPGFVSFPKGPRATDYVNCMDNNFVVIPSCYDADRAWRIAFAWDLFTDETYAYDESEIWKEWYKNDFDERAVNETLAMMREKVTISNHNLVPGFDLGNDFLWHIPLHNPSYSVSDAIDANHVKIENSVREANGEPIVIEDVNYGITNKSLTLFDYIAVTFKTPTLLSETGYHDPYLLVKMNGKEAILKPEQKDNMLVYSLNVAPHMLGDEIIVEPHATDAQGRDIAGERTRYSVKTYCMNMLNKEAYAGSEFADLRKLCVDILFYGEKAQKYDNYKTDDLVTADLTWEQIQMGTDQSVQMVYNSVKDKEYETVSAADKRAEIAAAALYLEGAVIIQFKFTAEDLSGLRVVVTDGTNVLDEYVPDSAKKDSKGRYYIDCNALNASQMRKTVYATVMKGDKKVSNTYCYSIESYAANMVGKGNESLDYLLGAMMRYGDSAAEFKRNH
ncbi:MAG: extracellular solute-binding protein [Acetatifactor sp.]|nr:extracellular solute-binding protein [Acetatifactor sp.]